MCQVKCNAQRPNSSAAQRPEQRSDGHLLARRRTSSVVASRLCFRTAGSLKSAPAHGGRGAGAGGRPQGRIGRTAGLPRFDMPRGLRPGGGGGP
ncbi:unnamed protein product [Ectocarpus fasciculatus]